MSGRDTPGFDYSVSIAASPGRVIGAFFDPAALVTWWQTIRSVTTPRPLGAYAVEWEPTEFRDEVLGPLGGAFHGVVMEFKPAREFFIADAYWLPPQGDPIGPMALEVSCTLQRDSRGPRTTPELPLSIPRTLLRVRQSGYQESERWLRYYEVIASGWARALDSLKRYLEEGPRRRA